jgi:hypothetical protein
VNIALANPSIIQSNTITNSQLVQAPFYTVKGVNQAPLVVTNASGTGSTVTLTFSGAYLITPGSIITVSGITPSGYNGVYSATASTSTTVSYSNSTTGVYVSGGTIASSQNISDIPIGTVSSFNSATPLNILTTDTPWNAAAFVTLTDASTITPDFSTGFNFQVTVAGNRTIANPTNTKPGQSGVILIVQDSTGGRTISFGSSFKFSNGTAPTLSTTANSTNALFYYVVNSSFIVANNLGGVA